MEEVAGRDVNGPLFPGSTVKMQSVVSREDSQQLSFTLMTFAAGGRNAFHTHTHDQVLVVVSGSGVVATETDQRVMTTEDVVLIPAGENHWHAGTESEPVSFLSITPQGTTTSVTD